MMTIAEARQAKLKVAQVVLKLLQAFETESGARVDWIEIDRESRTDTPYLAANVRIGTSIP